MRIFLRIITLLFTAITFSVCGVAQTAKFKPSKTIKEFVPINKNKSNLSMKLLKAASSITYSFSNGAVHPDCQYIGYITVTPNSVAMMIYHDSCVRYSESRALTKKEYNNFLNSVHALGIKKSSNTDIVPLCGGGASDIEIKRGNKILFEGSENLSITTTNGWLADPFSSILNESMERVYEDPSITFNFFDNPALNIDIINQTITNDQQ